MSKDIRFHIGNISAELHATPSRLEDRLSKFGTIKEGLSFHSKPLGDHYFAYITLTVNEAQVERLKKAFNGVIFMGRKLSLDIAKSSPYLGSNFVKEEPLKKQIEKEEGIQRARQERIDESKAIQRLNSITGSIITPHYISSKQQALGYTVSCHTYGDISGNTRSSKPGKVLYGSKSYGAWTVPKLKQTNAQHYANLAGAGEIIKGRLRKTPRPKSHLLKRQQTLRILINGELKSIKSYKTKLWGLEKNKTVLDLTWRYANGEWRSGDDHIIERKRVKVLESSSSCGIGGSEALTYGTKTSNNDDHDNEVEDDHMDEVDSDEETRREAERNKSILASLFLKDTFERPVKVDDNDNGIDKEDIVYDSKGRRKVIRHDLEMMEIVQEEGGDEEVEDTSAAQQLIEAYKNEAVRPQDEVYYDESDEGNELDISELTKTEAVNNEELEFEVAKQVVDDDEEEKDIDVPRNITNKTDTLRSIFSTESNSGFKLALSEDDEDVDDDKQRIDEEQEKLLEEIKKKQRQEEEKMLFNSKLARYGLFWSHSDSPFLLTQSQLQKLGTTIKLPGETELDQQQQQQYLGQDETEYEKWFWSQRGDLSRECKRQKRDAIRRRKGRSIA